MFGFDPIGEVVDMFGLGLLRWVRESEVRQKLLIEKGSVLEGEATDGKRKGIRGRNGRLAEGGNVFKWLVRCWLVTKQLTLECALW